MLLKFSTYGFLKNLRFFEPFLYLFFLENGLSFFQIGLLISIKEISVNLLEIPTGAIADLKGRRKAMIFSFSSYLFSFAIFYLFSDFFLFIPAMFLFAAGESFRSGTHKAMIMEYLDITDRSSEQVNYYGKTRSASRLGSALSAILAALIVYFRGNYNVVFLASLVPYSMDLLLMTTYPKELDGKIKEGGFSLKEIYEQLKDSFISLSRTPQLGKVLVNASVYDSIFKIGKDYLQPIIKIQATALPVLLFLKDGQARTSILIGVVYFFVYLNSFISSRYSSGLMEKVGDIPRAVNLLLWINLGFMVVAGFWLRADLVIPVILSFFVFYSLYNLRKPMVVGFLGQRIEGKRRSTLLSIHSQLRSLVGIVIAPLFGFLADSFGVFSVLLAGGFLLLMVGLFLRIGGENKV